MKKISKTDRYRQRIQEKNHHVRMFVDNGYFKQFPGNGTPRNKEIEICKKFNAIAETYTKSNVYIVLLNMGIPQIAADFHYQHGQLLRWAEGKGFLHEVHEDFNNAGITAFYKSIRQAVPQGVTAFESDTMLQALPKINKGSAVAVLLYMKARCSRPTSTGGVTNLMDKTIAKGLSISRRTVNRARELLEQNGLIEIVHKNAVHVGEGNKIVTYSKYMINI